MKFEQNKQLYIRLANSIRILAVDAVEKANSGHPGMPLGMAEIMTILAFDILKYNPKDPEWFNRDRLILSNGHGSMLLYAFYYLTGYKDFELKDIKQFRKGHSKTPGHPEYGAYSAIETTTGPLGQGFANAVGMAIAQKKYQQKYGSAFCDHKIYVIVGDGCLMEGISYEAASLAGHLGLNNLIILFDNNQITIDGNVNLSCSEDQALKFKAMGWKTDEIDGHDPEAIYRALKKAQNTDKPIFIACKTIIGKYSQKAGSEKAHGAPLGKEAVALLKQNLNFPPEDFAIPQDLLEIWQAAAKHNVKDYSNWKNYPEACLKSHGKILTQTLKEFADNILILPKPQATRVSSGIIIAELLKNSDQIICGSADLSISNNIKSNVSKSITKDDFSGNLIHYGVREHAMSAIMSGFALYGFLPIGGTFLVFSDYMKPAIRLAAMMRQKVIYILTHDSIGIGEDGPTHQPVEQLASLRSIPNLLVMRPADFIETIECFQIALDYQGPTAFALTRQNVEQINAPRNNNLSSKGAYIIQDTKAPDVTIFATGSEVSLALETAVILEAANIMVKIISVPCFNLFLTQDQNYINSICNKPKLKVAIEAAASFGWHQIIGNDGMFFGVEDFGVSAHYNEVYKHFGLAADVIAEKIIAQLSVFFRRS